MNWDTVHAQHFANQGFLMISQLFQQTEVFVQPIKRVQNISEKQTIKYIVQLHI